uniref:Uncharacterized protein n=1 Tax=Anguilla anguilla TaxID=7936 RepID=A0A0E9QBH4_ANGAN
MITPLKVHCHVKMHFIYMQYLPKQRESFHYEPVQHFEMLSILSCWYPQLFKLNKDYKM